MKTHTKINQYEKNSDDKIVKIDSLQIKTYDFSWPVHQYKILYRNQIPVKPNHPGQQLLRILGHKKLEWPEQGIFVPKGLRAFDKPPEPLKTYEPVEEIEKILKDVQNMKDVTDPKALLKFVNRWGSLGIGIESEEWFYYDSVSCTAKYLGIIKNWIRDFHKLQKEGGSKKLLDGLADHLESTLVNIHPGVIRDKGKILPVFHLHRLIDAIYLGLWEMIIDGKNLRRCPKCQALFTPDRTNQLYCDDQCQNSFKQFKHRKKTVAFKLFEEGQKPIDIAKSVGVELQTVKLWLEEEKGDGKSKR